VLQNQIHPLHQPVDQILFGHHGTVCIQRLLQAGCLKDRVGFNGLLHILCLDERLGGFLMEGSGPG
jgi:hypothetical protein